MMHAIRYRRDIVAVSTMLLIAGSACMSPAHGTDLSGVSYDLEVGLDAWDLRPSVDRDTAQNQSSNTRLFLANSTPYWTYENISPWIKFQGSVRLLDNTKLSMRYRRDVSSGSRLDELSIDHSHSGVGIRAGVLDYKTSWCRTYEVDSPWVRENDPFCTVRTTSQSIRAAPGMQLYANGAVGDLQLQAIAGLYNPLQFDYTSTEFTNTVLNAYSKVVKNDKVGLSLNVTDVTTALELRLSLLHTDQAAHYRAGPAELAYRIEQTVDVVYAGISFNPVPPLTVRLTHLESNMQGKYHYPAGWVRLDDYVAQTTYRDSSPKTSNVLELNYQASARDVFALAYSVYDLATDATNYEYDPITGKTTAAVNPDAFDFRNTNTSISWRRDWKKGVFTVVQWTQAQAQSSYRPGPAAPLALANSNGTALGLRLGYRF